jgi:hypothetical protein
MQAHRYRRAEAEIALPGFGGSKTRLDRARRRSVLRIVLPVVAMTVSLRTSPRHPRVPLRPASQRKRTRPPPGTALGSSVSDIRVKPRVSANNITVGSVPACRLRIGSPFTLVKPPAGVYNSRVGMLRVRPQAPKRGPYRPYMNRHRRRVPSFHCSFPADGGIHEACGSPSDSGVASVSVLAGGCRTPPPTQEEMSAFEYGPRPENHETHPGLPFLKTCRSGRSDSRVQNPKRLYQQDTTLRALQYGWGVCVWVNDKNARGAYDGPYPWCSSSGRKDRRRERRLWRQRHRVVRPHR